MGWDSPYGSPMSREQLERRRLAAAEDLRRGVRQADVARKYGVSEASASRWARALRTGGLEALRARKATGVHPKRDQEDLRRLPWALARGATAYGWSTDLWTTKRVAEVIRREFGMAYAYNCMGHLLASLGFFHGNPSPARVRIGDRAG